MTWFKLRSLWCCGCVLASLLLLGGSALAETVVVTSAQSPLSALEKNQVRDLFLGKISSLPDGTTAILIDQPEASSLRNEFYLRVTNRSAAQAGAQWAKLHFTGRGVPPREGASTDDIKKFLTLTPGAIGYIEDSAVDASIRVLYTVK